MATARLMNENGSLFSHSAIEIQLNTPKAVLPQLIPATALHEAAPAYRTKPVAKKSRSPRKTEPAAG